jgi:hypothetical protein
VLQDFTKAVQQYLTNCMGHVLKKILWMAKPKPYGKFVPTAAVNTD